jgi:hypothetical protein
LDPGGGAVLCYSFGVAESALTVGYHQRRLACLIAQVDILTLSYQGVTVYHLHMATIGRTHYGHPSLLILQVDACALAQQHLYHIHVALFACRHELVAMSLPS